jgi:hypothetical protein
MFLKQKFLLISLFFIFLTGCNFKELPIVKDLIVKNREEATKYTEEAIKNSPELQELDKMCSQIPLPKDFKFISKGGLDDQAISLSTYYYSETSYQEAKQLFKDYFNQKGWNLIKEDDSYPKVIEFKDNTFLVSLQYGGMGSDVNYSIYCEKISSFTTY